VKKDIVQLIFSILVLVLSCAAEELLPSVSVVGVPVLLSVAMYSALNRTPIVGLLFALAAGAAEDSLGSLPVASSVSFFVLVCAILRGFKLPLVVGSLAFPLYQFWVWVWLGSAMQGGILLRMLISIPVGVVTLLLVWLLLHWFDGKAAINEK
jgi:hypothetical protein